ncbi:holo-ACP synthase, partial [Vibrio cholerae]
GRYLAKRFAAKEAASKALGTGIAHGVSFQDFAISNDDNGKPLLSLSGKAAELAQRSQVASVHLTISDERHYAVATVILEA